MRLVRSLQLERFHTFTSLSQPPDTIRGWEALGEKETQETHSPWPSPSETLISGTTIDWFLRWPSDALQAVSGKFIDNEKFHLEC